MIVSSCSFDPIRDLLAVEPFGSIDLKDALANGSIPSQLPDSETAYNGIEDPTAILGKPRDVFEAMSMESQINSFSPGESSEEKSE